MTTKSYKFIYRLIEKITKRNAPLNNTFDYYGYNVTQQSGSNDYTNVIITNKSDNKIVAQFSIDFLTQKVYFENYIHKSVKDKIIFKLNKLYSYSFYVYDQLLLGHNTNLETAMETYNDIDEEKFILQKRN